MATAKPKVTVFICDTSLGAQAFLDTSRLPELTMIADIETVIINSHQAAEININTWEKLANAIYQRKNKSTGFVIIHGTDGILYTSTAISFLLNGFNKPIIFTGTLPNTATDKSMEMRANIINSIQAATYTSSEVGLIFGNRFLRAIKSELGADQQINFFDAPAEAILGKIDFSIRVFGKMFHNKSAYKNKPPLSIEKDIVTLRLSPLISVTQFKKLIEGYKGCVIDLSDYHHLPEKLAEEIINQTKDKTIVVWSKNSSLASIANSQLVVANHSTWHATVTKLIWACSISKSQAQIKALMKKPLDHEIL
jgi:L-asparaginase